MNPITVALAVLLSPVAAPRLGQQTPTNPPLLVSDLVTTQTATGWAGAFRVTNTSDKPIRAFVIAIESFDATGKAGGRTSRVGVRGTLPPPQPATLAPGETISERLRKLPVDSAGNPFKVQTSVDYVLFVDGSWWGPNTLNESRRISGILTGHDQTLIALRDMLDEQGPDAVIAYLKNLSLLGP